MSSKPGPKMQAPTHKSVLDCLRQNSCPFSTTGDVAEQFPEVTRRTVRSRLHDLADEGEIQRREVGANGVIWYTAD